jgi:DNA-binding GntR family transcriptional regulator
LQPNFVAEHVALIEAMQRRDRRNAARIIKAHNSQTENAAGTQAQGA